ncbi:MAG: haloacid dehalogenase-like hydrolase [Chloroflexi bacterium]|nr:haloacid dehalogenase-like hydrolase [Chloroflexota bacterium]
MTKAPKSALAAPLNVIWDFDGTLLPYDSEQALLRSLLRPPLQVGLHKALLARALSWADRHNLMERSFKRWYVRCLRGLPVEALDRLARQVARDISDADRRAIDEIRALGARMFVVSCGTGDLSQRILEAAGVAAGFLAIEANWFTFWGNRIEGMDLSIHLPADKLAAVKGLGISISHAVMVGDGITDLPLLDEAAYPILLDRAGRKATLIRENGYLGAASLPEVARLLSNIVANP